MFGLALGVWVGYIVAVITPHRKGQTIKAKGSDKRSGAEGLKNVMLSARAWPGGNHSMP